MLLEFSFCEESLATEFTLFSLDVCMTDHVLSELSGGTASVITLVTAIRLLARMD